MRFSKLRFGSLCFARRRIIPPVFRLSVLAACVLTLATGLWAAGGGMNAGVADLTLRTLPVPSHWITAMVRGSHGTWWIGTEGKGLYCWRPGQPANAVLTHFSRPQGAPANVYALTCDHRGRIWAGSLNHGVCVYNGHGWREYGASPDFGLSTGRNANRGRAGPLGQRIFGLAVSPLDGAVWIATDMGLAVYHSQTHRWRYVTTGNGLACNDLSCVAFAPNGDVYVGTQCHGILAATAADHYAHWRRIWTKTASVRFSHGAGLPDNLINCLLIVPRSAVQSGHTAFTLERTAVWPSDGKMVPYGGIFAGAITLTKRNFFGGGCRRFPFRHQINWHTCFLLTTLRHWPRTAMD